MYINHKTSTFCTECLCTVKKYSLISKLKDERLVVKQHNLIMKSLNKIICEAYLGRIGAI